ncbi:hypothetical protein [Streptomyces sp. NPDC050560]|uniref:hypothetical protein n=1 Tax=Streptomyces sp. NPDC050560 TaxID=3365630 RepID=UPI0037A93500
MPGRERLSGATEPLEAAMEPSGAPRGRTGVRGAGAARQTPRGGVRAVRPLRAVLALVGGALWWWAALRLALAPRPGVVEAAAVAGGWGLSVLPVHCVPKDRAGRVVRGRHLTRAGEWLRLRLRYARRGR